MSHFAVLLVFATLVALVFAVLQKDTPREQAVLGLKIFAAFVAAGLALGWIMLPFPLGR
jgi:energy-coupling factor transporter transmembrane protein EcfT